MGYIRRVVTTLRASGPMCDECLSEATRITPRQRVAMLAIDLSRAGRLLRKKTKCPQCGRNTRVTGEATARPPERKKGFFAWLLGGGAE